MSKSITAVFRQQIAYSKISAIEPKSQILKRKQGLFGLVKIQMSSQVRSSAYNLRKRAGIYLMQIPVLPMALRRSKRACCIVVYSSFESA